jgi:hypothetical protein
MLRDVVSSQYRWVNLRILVKRTSPPVHSSCGQTRPKAVLRESPLMVSIRVCAAIIQWKRQQRHKSPFGVLVDRSDEHLSHSRTKRHVSPMMIELLCGLPKLLLKRCHHLIHHLTCMLFLCSQTIATRRSWMELLTSVIAIVTRRETNTATMRLQSFVESSCKWSYVE